VLVVSTVGYALGTPALSQYALGFFDRVGGSGPRGDERRPDAIESPGGLWSLVIFPANAFRRLYGPFIWIPPDEWHFRALQAGDYLLYPGMLVWYGLIPFFAAGFVWCGRRVVLGQERQLPTVLLWAFAAVYFVQYMAINLSYRQRDVMLPFVLVFACMGASYVTRWGHWRRLYAAYWLALAVLAAAHLAARAWLRA
jgi:hypothetical protein